MPGLWAFFSPLGDAIKLKIEKAYGVVFSNAINFTFIEKG